MSALEGVDPKLSDGLLEYFRASEQARTDYVAATWNSLSPREQRLMKEAAVMGYVQGVRMHGPMNAEIPPDSTIVYQVIASCRSNEDLYPFISGLTRRRKAGA